MVLREGSLDPGLASKFAGRYAFLNHWIFNRVGRALLRPIIWRQKQTSGPYTFTCRLRNSLMWLLALSNDSIYRSLPLRPCMSVFTVILYTDAEGNGGVDAVADLDGMIVFLRGNILVCVRQMLHKRRTNIAKK